MHIKAQDIITEARGWLGTRFHHQGRLKKTANHKGGCDCIGLVVGVASALGLSSRQDCSIQACDQHGYGRLPDGSLLQAALEAHLHKVDEAQPGDIGLFRFETQPQHVAIFSDHPQGLGLIHCYAQIRKVVEHRFDPLWQQRLVGVYRFE